MAARGSPDSVHAAKQRRGQSLLKGFTILANQLKADKTKHANGSKAGGNSLKMAIFISAVNTGFPFLDYYKTLWKQRASRASLSRDGSTQAVQKMHFYL